MNPVIKTVTYTTHADSLSDAFAVVMAKVDEFERPFITISPRTVYHDLSKDEVVQPYAVVVEGEVE